MTEEDFINEWNLLPPADKLFIESYLDTFDIYSTEVSLGEGVSHNSYRVRARQRWARTRHLIYFIMKRDGHVSDFFNKWNVKNEMLKVYRKAEAKEDLELQRRLLNDMLEACDDTDDSTVDKKMKGEVKITFTNGNNS